MIDVSIRLRRAIVINDLLLVKRIIQNHPDHLRNPDFSDKGNTSLHLSAKLGSVAIAEYLIDAGHEADGISRNADWDTPLIVACEGQEHVARLLAQRFERSVQWKNKAGVDALMTAARHGLDGLVTFLLTAPSPPHRADVNAQDLVGNTPLHYASSYGELKVIRTLLAHDANPLLRNHYSWTPISYSSTVQAEVYFKNLVLEMERRRAAAVAAAAGSGSGGGGAGGAGKEVRPGVRLVSWGSAADGAGGGGGGAILGEGEEEWGSPGRRVRAGAGGAEGGGTPTREWGEGAFGFGSP